MKQKLAIAILAVAQVGFCQVQATSKPINATPAESKPDSSETKTAKAEVPDAPSSIVRTKIDAREAVRKGICTKEGEWYRCPASVQVTFPHERVATPSFTGWMIASSAAMVADFESTARAVQNGCREMNPIYGSRPDRARLYAIGVPLHTFVTWLTYRSKRSGYKYWWFAQASLTATHALATGLNASHC